MITSKQRRHLRSLAHHRSPVVTLGSAGLTASLLTEIERALEHHELIKIRPASADRSARHALYRRICALTTAEPVQQIGGVVVIFRPASQSRQAPR
ncbi:MAG: ribosome assembly RNA-binding protein YhbY [Acidiferrobacterales bacterium]